MIELEKFQELMRSYGENYNQCFNKHLQMNEDFFGDTIRMIDFLNHYYHELLKENKKEELALIQKNFSFLRHIFTGIDENPIDLSQLPISPDEFRQSKKGVLKVRRIIPTPIEKHTLFSQLLDLYQLFNEEFEDQEYLVYTNNSIHSFELKPSYFPHVIGLSLEDAPKDMYHYSEKEKEYYQNLPRMLERMNQKEVLQNLDQYEHKRNHSLFNYAYLKVKSSSFLSIYNKEMPLFVCHTDHKEGSNIKINVFLSKPVKLEEQLAYVYLGFHENSKFNEGYAESGINLLEKKKVHGECGITTALFRKNKSKYPRNLKLVKLYTMNEQIQFIEFLLPYLENGHVKKELTEYQNRLKRSLFDYMNLECQITRQLSNKTL